mgnify:FL=1
MPYLGLCTDLNKLLLSVPTVDFQLLLSVPTVDFQLLLSVSLSKITV